MVEGTCGTAPAVDELGAPLRVVVDAVVARPGTSISIVIEHVLAGWVRHAGADELHVLLPPDTDITVPDGVVAHRAPRHRVPALDRQLAHNVTLPRLCRSIGADAVLASTPSTSVVPLHAALVVLTHDLRHEVHPEQFSRSVRLKRHVSYGLAWRQAAAITCVSERTRQDLLRPRRWLRDRIVDVAHLGSDHTDSWPRDDPRPPAYAVAFGHFGNKNVDLVLDAWVALHERGEALPLRILGLSAEGRAATAAVARGAGVGELVTPLGWLADDEHHRTVANASLVVFPSGFEGFGLPAVEGMRLGVPVVVSPDPALVEVTAGHAAVMAGWTADDLAHAVVAARRGGIDPEAARARADALTWERTAASMRATVVAAVAREGGHRGR